MTDADGEENRRSDGPVTGANPSRRRLLLQGLAVLAVVVAIAVVASLWRNAGDPGEDEARPPLPSCLDVLGTATTGPADDGFNLAKFEPVDGTVHEEEWRTWCRFDGRDEVEGMNASVTLQATYQLDAAGAAAQLRQSACGATVDVVSDGQGRDSVSCVIGEDPQKVQALYGVAAGELWVWVNLLFQRVDPQTDMTSDDEARAAALTRAVADALLELVPA